MRILVSTAAVIWILITARDVLQPLAIGILVWLVLTAAAQRISSLLPAPIRRGRHAVRIAGGLGTLLVLLLVGILVAENIASLRANLPLYQGNLDTLVADVSARLGLRETPRVADLLARIDTTGLAISIAGSTAAYTASLFVVIVYVVFIFVEAEAVDAKIAAFAGDRARERRTRRFLASLRRGVNDFLAVQVLVGLIQAVPTYLLLTILGVDAPLFFAVMIFVFSFIPTIGTLVGIAFPALMTLLQFGTFGPFLIVVGVLGAIQVFCSNVLAPQMMSRSLNLSPLVVLFAVFAGGAVWGIVGALIAVPVLTIAAIACAEEPSLRHVAVILSANGALPPPGSDDDGPSAAALANRRDTSEDA